MSYSVKYWILVFLIQRDFAGCQCSATNKTNDIHREYSLFDFTTTASVDDWKEQSDTVRDVGMSKAVLTLQQTKVFRRAVFFALLNPQPNGAGFAGMRHLGMHNLTQYSKLQLRCRSQGQFHGYKVTLRHKNLNEEPNLSFEQTFQAPKDTFDEHTLPFTEFKPYYRGKRINSTEPMDTSHISSICIQVFGGVYLPVKQRGPFTLEIDWIKAIE